MRAGRCWTRSPGRCGSPIPSASTCTDWPRRLRCGPKGDRVCERAGVRRDPRRAGPAAGGDHEHPLRHRPDERRRSGTSSTSGTHCPASTRTCSGASSPNRLARQQLLNYDTEVPYLVGGSDRRTGNTSATPTGRGPGAATQT